MCQLVEQKFDGSYVVSLYRMLANWFIPNASILKWLRETQVVVGSQKMNAIQMLRDELLQKGVDVDGHESVSASYTADHKAENKKNETLKTVVASSIKQSDSSHVTSGSLSKEDQHKFAHLYQQVSKLVSEAKFVVVMPSAFDLKDADGNLLLSVENATYDDEDYSEEGSDYSQAESDPEGESNTNKKR